MEQQFVYQTDQMVSVTTRIDVALADGEVVQILVNSKHNAAAEKIAADVFAHIDALQQVRDVHPRPARSAPPVEPEGGKKWERKAVAATEDGRDMYAEQFNRVQITARPDGKGLDMAFLKDGLEFPVMKASAWKPERVATVFAAAGVTLDDPAASQTVERAGVVRYVDGKEYKPGKHYKDLVDVAFE
jgi:hypothetical protein